MNRRSFLRLFGAGLPSVVVAEKIGLIEKARSYFFAPKGGWPEPPEGWRYEVYYANAAGILTRPNAGIITGIRAPERCLFEGQEFGLYDSSGNLRADGRIVIRKIDRLRKIVEAEHLPFSVQVGDLLMSYEAGPSGTF